MNARGPEQQTAHEPGQTDGIITQAERRSNLLAPLTRRLNSLFNSENGRGRFNLQTTLAKAGVPTITRRRFIQLTSAAIASAAALGVSPKEALAQALEFEGDGFKYLHSLLGEAVMGKPTTHAFPDPKGTGDVQQKTDMGLAFWRKATNLPTYTNGFEHWARTSTDPGDPNSEERSKGLAYWTGESIDPPGYGTLPGGPGATEVAGETVDAPLSFEQRVAIEREKHPIYTQFVNADGIMVKAPDEVKSESLEITKKTVLDMLSYRPDIKDKLTASGVQVLVMPQSMRLTEFPEFTHLSGKYTKDGLEWERVRSIGANSQNMVSAYGEEELLTPLKDGILVHEFAHAIMNLGFTIEERQEVWRLYLDYKEAFDSSYMTKNPEEFFAVGAEIHKRTLARDLVNAKKTSNGVVDPEQLKTLALKFAGLLENTFGPPPATGAK